MIYAGGASCWQPAQERRGPTKRAGRPIEATRDSRTTSCVFGLFTNQIMLPDRLAFRREKHSLWDAKLSFALEKA